MYPRRLPPTLGRQLQMLRAIVEKLGDDHSRRINDFHLALWQIEESCRQALQVAVGYPDELGLATVPTEVLNLLTELKKESTSLDKYIHVTVESILYTEIESLEESWRLDNVDIRAVTDELTDIFNELGESRVEYESFMNNLLKIVDDFQTKAEKAASDTYQTFPVIPLIRNNIKSIHDCTECQMMIIGDNVTSLIWELQLKDTDEEIFRKVTISTDK